jgi:putative hydrolase of the HAD superfamily
MESFVNSRNYQALIFDLGGVLLNIDYQASKRAFEALGVDDFDAHFSQLSQSHLFDDFERGKLSPANFRKAIKKEIRINCSDKEIDHAWNAMLLDFPLHRIELLETLSNQLPLYLFSNTNAIHIDLFKERMSSLGLLNRFEKAFKTRYYSFEIGRRKPDAESFRFILAENNLSPESTLFIDDSPQHIEGAKKVGIESILLSPKTDISQLFKL